MNTKTISTARLTAITDGVFAIAMTLLVLDIKVPHLPDGVSSQAFATALLDEVPSVIGWLISFAILCRLWITQHALLEEGTVRTRTFAGVNFLFLGMISFIPFPTALMSEHSDQALAVIIFSATYGIASLTLGWMWYLLAERAADGSARPATISPAVKHVVILMPSIALLACLLALANPNWGVLLWTVLPFALLLTKKRRKPAKARLME